jgi:hypothetical protein
MRLLVMAALALAAGAADAATTRRSVKILRSPFVPHLRKLSEDSIVRIERHRFLSQRKYQDLRNAVVTLLRRYPPSRHYFIGTGRDPAPLIAALQNLGGRRLAISFPASNIVGGSGTSITSDLMDKYFRRLVPDAGLRQEIFDGKRAIVLVDQSSSGKTPHTLAPYIRRYLQRIKSPAEIKKVALTESKDNVYKDVNWISTKPFPDVDRYLYDPYEGVVSEFDHHVLGSDDINSLKPRAAYQRFKQAVLERMKRDPELHKFLTSRFGARRDSDVAEADRDRPRLELARGGVTYSHLSPAQYEQIRDAGLALVSKYPPSQYSYVFLGRSSAPLMAFVDAVNPDQASYFPTDGLRRDDDEEAGSLFQQRAKRFLSETVAQDKAILLIQRTDSGELLRRVAGLMRDQLRESGQRRKVETVALSSQAVEGTRWQSVAESPELSSLSNDDSGYRLLAPFQRRGKAGPNEKFDRNPSYARYRKVLREQLLAQDAKRGTIKQAFAQ